MMCGENFFYKKVKIAGQYKIVVYLCPDFDIKIFRYIV
jgi:hypothetical protein